MGGRHSNERYYCSDKMRKSLAFVAILAILIALIIYVCAPRDESLQMVHVLFRHGERSPSSSYTNDPFKDYSWPGGWDQLSIRGKMQEYKLGIELRKRYKHFLPSTYDPREFEMQSSYADRCLMSAQLLLAGLFPPMGEDVWNAELPWQPIPVHSLPRNMDNKIAIKRPCPAFQKALNESYLDLGDVNLQNRKLFDYLSENTGDQIRDIRTLETLYNTLEIEQLNGLQLPDWTRSVFPEQMQPLAAMSLALFTKTPRMKRLHGGVLAKEILENMERRVRKMIMYSGHDLTVVTLLNVLGFTHEIKPDFGATILIELHRYNTDDYVVRFFYMHNPDSEPKEIHLPACGDRGCRLAALRALITPVLPDNWEIECNIV